jgi:N-acetylglucosaminyldiphosphoundecaprenol N-acetyl-beta-D-mannosaminyltransferase
MRAHVLNAPVDALSLEETVRRARLAMSHRKITLQTSLNVAKLVKMRRDPELHEDVVSSDIISADGMGIVIASRLLGLGVRERIAGIDLMTSVLKLCAQEGFRPYFFGATEDVVLRAAATAVDRFPGLQMAGTRNGFFGSDQEPEIVSHISSSKADCLFVGLPTPRKERFLKRYRNELKVPFIMGVGGSFDVLAGNVRRAPHWMQMAGFEWLFRVYQEPRRMWWRYASTNVVFAYLLASAVAASIHESFARNRSIQ